MQYQTRSLRLGACIRNKVLNKLYIDQIKLNVFLCSHWSFSSVASATQHTPSFDSLQTTVINPLSITQHSNITYPYHYEIRLGPVTANIPSETLQKLTQQCSDECIITKTRNCKALYIESHNHNDIITFQSLIYEEFLQHRSTINAGDKTRFVGGPNYCNIDTLQLKTNAFIYLHFKSGEISIYGTKSAVNKATNVLNEYLNKIIFIELDNKISWICARNHSWIDRMKGYYKCEIYSEPTGRLVIIAEPHITKRIVQSVQEGLAKAPSDADIKNKKVDQHKLKQKVESADNIGDIMRIVRNNHYYVNINNIHSIFNRLCELRQSEMEQETLMLNINDFDKYRYAEGQKKLDDALVMRRKKNNDYIYFMSKYARKMLQDVTNIVTVAQFIWCFALFGTKDKNTWRLVVDRLLQLYEYDDARAHNQKGKDLNTMSKKLYAIGKCFSAFSLIHPIEYDDYHKHIAFLLKELHGHIPDLGGSVISYVLDAMSNDEKFMNLCRDCSFLRHKDDNVWMYLGNADNYRSIDNMGHVNVCLILKSICILYPDIHDSPYVIDTVLNLCNELFFYHESMEIEYSIQMLAHLSYLGFYEKSLFDFLLPMNKVKKIDINDAKIYNKSSIHQLLYAFGKTLHVTHPEILRIMNKKLIEYRSTFSFSQYIECVWSVLCIHFVSSSQRRTNADVMNDEETFLLSKKMMTQLLKTMSGRLADCDVSFIANDIVMKLLQMNCISKILKVESTLMEASFENMLKDGLQSELLMRYKENEENEVCVWDRNEYNMFVLKCLNRIFYGNEIESESFLMKNKYELTHGNTGIKSKKMQFDHVEANGLIVNLCVDDRKKRGIMMYGPKDVFIDNDDKLCGENYINYHILTTYFDWDLLCLNWKTHQTEHSITTALKQWLHQQQKYVYFPKNVS